MRKFFSAELVILLLVLFFWWQDPDRYKPLLFVALMMLFLWILRLPNLLTTIDEQGVTFWSWGSKKFVPWQDFVELDSQSTQIILRTEQTSYRLNLRWQEPDTAKRYFDLAAAHVPMSADLQSSYQQAQFEQQQTILYAHWPVSEAVDLPVQIRVKPMYFALIGAGSLVSLFPSMVLFLGGDLKGAGVALLIGLIGPAILVWLLMSSCRIDAQGVQMQTLLGRYAIAWQEIEQVRSNVDEQQLGNFLVLEGGDKRLVLNLGMYQDAPRFKQALLQQMAAHGVALKRPELYQVRTRNTKI
jgi:hypothetical protein